MTFSRISYWQTRNIATNMLQKKRQSEHLKKQSQCTHPKRLLSKYAAIIRLPIANSCSTLFCYLSNCTYWKTLAPISSFNKGTSLKNASYTRQLQFALSYLSDSFRIALIARNHIKQHWRYGTERPKSSIDLVKYTIDINSCKSMFQSQPASIEPSLEIYQPHPLSSTKHSTYWYFEK